MMHYARQDTRHLLYVYDRMRLALVAAGKMEDALARSRVVTVRVWDREQVGRKRRFRPPVFI